MNVPFVDLAALHRPHMQEFQSIFERVVNSSAFIMGPEIQGFEKAFAAYVGTKECLTVNSGTSALHLAMLALGVGPGDEVVTTPHTFIATAEGISAVGARPVFVDVDPSSYTLDPTKLAAAITPKTKAIVPVHLYGQCADMDPIMEIANRHGIPVVEDACQAHGSIYKGRHAGSIGAMSCFSFYPGKNLGAFGEGGAVLCNDVELAKKVRMLRDHGSVKKYEHEVAGYNFRLEGLQGAILNAKLPRLDAENDRRRKAAALYAELLADSTVVTPREMGYGKHVYHLFVVQVSDAKGLADHLGKNGVGTGYHYPVPLHLQEAYKKLGYKRGDFPVTESLARSILSLPMYPDITREAVEYVCGQVKEFVCPKAVAVALR